MISFVYNFTSARGGKIWEKKLKITQPRIHVYIIMQTKVTIFLVKLKSVKIMQTKVTIFLVKLKTVKIIQTKVTIFFFIFLVKLKYVIAFGSHKMSS